MGAEYRGFSFCDACDDGVGGNREEGGGYGDEGEGCVDVLMCRGCGGGRSGRDNGGDEGRLC